MISQFFKTFYSQTFGSLFSEKTTQQRDAIFYVLGLVGWALIVLNYPFGWELPEYAAY